MLIIIYYILFICMILLSIFGYLTNCSDDFYEYTKIKYASLNKKNESSDNMYFTACNGWSIIDEHCVKLDFNNFKSYYNINPKRYRLFDCYVETEIKVDMNQVKKITIVFNASDLLKYLHFVKEKKQEDLKEEKRKLTKKSFDLTNKYLETVKNDIEEYVKISKKIESEKL